MRITRRRVGKAIPWVLLLSALALVVTLVRSANQTGAPTTSNATTGEPGVLATPYFWIAIIAFVALALQTWVNLVQGVYNPTLVLKYQDLFESEKVRVSRAAAAKEFKSNRKYSSETREIETVLDVFEDIGFYVKHDEMSVEVAHHHFYHWVRGYIQTAKDYIDNYRRDEPTTYEHCELLLDMLSKFEAKKVKAHVSSLSWNEKDIDDFLDDEMNEYDGPKPG